MRFLSRHTKQGYWRLIAALVKDKILCFACAVKNIERTFNTYYELQDHLYRDHDVKKDPAMDIFNKYKSVGTENSANRQENRPSDQTPSS